MKCSPTVEAKTDSVWAATAVMPDANKLTQNVEADVCIVGAGIAGLTTGYLLTKAGKSVVILDDGAMASGMTQVTTAHLSNVIDDRFFSIEGRRGEEGSFLAAESHTAAIDRIEAIVNDLSIDCDFTRLDGYLFLAAGDDRELLAKELSASRRAGLMAEMVPRCPLDYNTGPAIRYPNQGRFHPLKYLAAVAKAIKKGGGRIYTNSHADKVEGGKESNVQVGEHAVRAGAIVVATNSPINNLVAIHTKQAPYMTYVIGARVLAGSVTDALYWDTLDPHYHYVRLQPMRGDDADSNGHNEYDLLIVGGEDHKSGQADDTALRHARLESWARARFKTIEDIEFTWGGQWMKTIDGLAFIGRNPLDAENVFIVTGDSGMGMTHGTIAGMLLTDLILGKQNPWATLYDPSRKPISGAATFTKEAANMAAQYLDWVTGSEVESVDDIEPGCGAVLRRGLSKVAVYRDEKGTAHEMSAVCPHLGCIVHWNGAEKSWDCPCHGSRFDKLGKVINGPSNVDLSPAE
ncbi:MAG TPA: FAD-dependent oxidoreductase [Lacipirellulaceae bacterium]|jgi:glycine/D-amino acid oxidase-like deaminating enzyme|nr:FAD-dependent oxidoreductase [Lacipirellulaceae bacterium]